MRHLGVAGLGWLGESLIKDVHRFPGFEVVGVQDVRVERATEIAAQYGIPWSAQDYEDLLGRDELDAVLICTPNAAHAGQALAALEAGKDVLVQKPLALSHSDAEMLVEAAQRTGKVLFVDYTYRFLETMRVFREAVESSGAIQALSATFHNIYGPGAEKRWFFDRSQSGGGALTDLGVHLLDLGLWLTEPRDVGVELAELAQSEPVEHAAELSLRLDSIPFELAVSWNAPRSGSEIALEARTEAATLRWENVDGSFFRFRSVRDGEVLLDRETTLREDTLRAFAAALEERRAPPIDLRVYAILDRAYGR